MLPGTLPADELAERLADTDSAAVLKLGRTFPAVRDGASRPPAARRGAATSSGPPPTGSASPPLAEVDPATVPYFSLALLPSAAAPGPRRCPGRRRTPTPAPARWSSSGWARAAASWTDARGGRRRWPRPTTWSATAPTSTGCRPTRGSAGTPSDNRVEAERAAFALELARARTRGWPWSPPATPGVFAMAAAVLEVAAGRRVRRRPGAGAARA